MDQVDQVDHRIFTRVERTTPDETHESNYALGQRRGDHHHGRGTKSQQMENLNRGRPDFGTRRAAKLWAGKGTLEPAVKHLYQLELSCDRENVQAPPQLNPEAPTFRPRRRSNTEVTYWTNFLFCSLNFKFYRLCYSSFALWKKRIQWSEDGFDC